MSKLNVGDEFTMRFVVKSLPNKYHSQYGASVIDTDGNSVREYTNYFPKNNMDYAIDIKRKSPQLKVGSKIRNLISPVEYTESILKVIAMNKEEIVFEDKEGNFKIISVSFINKLLDDGHMKILVSEG